ncbi:MAG: hypothetical protein IPJ87_10610 [Flavobacteriales bacterium]|nr:hypothetical protein [Flavobacteriales bacterium]MBK7942305.1 hypothetical protein [Flavobacteriales bacterium]MBK9699293.1 hypothetical protein [Flavobacteriales bacterium]
MPASAYVLFGAAVLWCFIWAYKATRSLVFLLILVALGALHSLLAAHGVHADAMVFPPPQMALLAPVLLSLIVCTLLPAGRRWMRGLPLFALTAIHVLRIPVELVLHQGFEEGLLPQDMTYAGFNFDIYSGISAVLLLPWLRSSRPPSRGVLIGWNIFCLVLLAIVVSTAVLSIPSSVQRINFDRPNVLLIAPPWILLPAVLVPAVLWSHVAALVGLFGRGVPKGSG